jgi:multiple sugar transport system permease protein/raffinose/stachyose/melibiose transport system permease protein
MQKGKVLSNKISARLFLAPAVIFFILFIAYPVEFIVQGSFFKCPRWRTCSLSAWTTISALSGQGFWHHAAQQPVLDRGHRLRPDAAGLHLRLHHRGEDDPPQVAVPHRVLHSGVTSVVAIAILFKNMFSPYQGLITNALYRMGFKGPFNWLGDVHSAIFA